LLTRLVGYIFEALDDQSIAVVMSSGNANNNDMHHLTPVEQLPQTLAEDIPNLILVGASDKQSRQAMYSRVGSDMVWAPGKEILVAGPHGIDQSLQTLDGTSYSGPLVAGLVAYYRGTLYKPGVESPLEDPEVVKKALKALSRTVQIRSYAQSEEPYVASNGNVFSWVVPTVWNGQLNDATSCLVDSEAEGCPEIDLNRNLEDISIYDLDESCDTVPITKKRGVKRAGRSTRARRQSGGTCPLLPGEDGGGDGGGGDGGGGGGDGGLSDQLGPAKTATYLSGPPSPTCTANCGTYCTDWWCRPNRTGQPPHFTEPTRLPSTTTRPPPPASSSVRPPLSASGTIPGEGPTTSPPPLPDLSNGDPWPTNCASTRTYTRCAAPGGGHIVCVATSMCAATSTTAPPTPTPSEPSSRRWVAIYFSELTMSSGMGPPSWSRYWSVYAGDAGTDYCGGRSVFEKTDSGATLQDPDYPGSDLGSFKAHGRTCRYENAGRGAPGRVECEGTNPDWWETCRAAQLDDDPIFGGIKACGVFDNPMYKLVMLCSWGEA
jgi:chitinase